MNKNSYCIGKSAEQLATNFLKNLGWKIIVNNYKTIYGEIDILAKKNKTLVAFEVKSRKDINQLFYSINKYQLNRIATTLTYFLSTKHHDNFIIRIDALLINFSNNKIKHIENIWCGNV